MNIDEQIANRITDIKEKVMEETQKLVDSSSGQAHEIPVIQVRNMRMMIIHEFQILGEKIPIMIKEDMGVGLNDDMNDLMLKLKGLREKLVDEKSKQNFILDRRKELSEQNRDAKRRKR